MQINNFLYDINYNELSIHSFAEQVIPRIEIKMIPQQFEALKQPKGQKNPKLRLIQLQITNCPIAQMSLWTNGVHKYYAITMAGNELLFSFGRCDRYIGVQALPRKIIAKMLSIRIALDFKA